MWRWVTRGLILTFFLALFAPGLLAQTAVFTGDLEKPDPAQVQSGMVLSRAGCSIRMRS